MNSRTSGLIRPETAPTPTSSAIRSTTQRERLFCSRRNRPNLFNSTFNWSALRTSSRKYIDEEDDTLPLKLGDRTMSCDTRFILGTNKRATIRTNWSWFRHHANIQEGEICAFQSSTKKGAASP